MPKLRSCTWNINLGRRLELILDTFASEPDLAELDVVALQEASEHAGQEDAATLAGHLGAKYEYRQVIAQHLGGRPQANALIWNSQRLSDPRCRPLDLPALSDPTGLPSGERWLLATVRSQRRGAVVLEATLAGPERIRIYSAHADILGFAHRLRQLGAILADDAAHPSVGMSLIAADLNTFGIGSRPSWQALHRMASSAGFKDLTNSVGWSHQVRGLPLRQKLDFVFARATSELTFRAWTLSSRASDHLPELVELRWP